MFWGDLPSGCVEKTDTEAIKRNLMELEWTEHQLCTHARSWKTKMKCGSSQIYVLLVKRKQLVGPVFKISDDNTKMRCEIHY